MQSDTGEEALDWLAEFDGRIHHLSGGYWLKFEFRRVAASRARQQGLKYSMTLHDPEGQRIVGYDNAHGGHGRTDRDVWDHRHRGLGDEGRPYKFTSFEVLLSDFEADVLRALEMAGLQFEVVDVSEVARPGRRSKEHEDPADDGNLRRDEVGGTRRKARTSRRRSAKR